MRKHHGKRWKMVRKLGKHNIKGITGMITQNTKRTGFNNSECTKIIKFSIFYPETHLRSLIENFYQSNQLLGEVNPGIL